MACEKSCSASRHSVLLSTAVASGKRTHFASIIGKRVGGHWRRVSSSRIGSLASEKGVGILVEHECWLAQSMALGYKSLTTSDGPAE